MKKLGTDFFFIYIFYTKDLRPLRLLALKIALPELVLVLALNPEVLAFFNLVPLKVLFVIIFH